MSDRQNFISDDIAAAKKISKEVAAMCVLILASKKYDRTCLKPQAVKYIVGNCNVRKRFANYPMAPGSADSFIAIIQMFQVIGGTYTNTDGLLAGLFNLCFKKVLTAGKKNTCNGFGQALRSDIVSVEVYEGAMTRILYDIEFSFGKYLESKKKGLPFSMKKVQQYLKQTMFSVTSPGCFFYQKKDCKQLKKLFHDLCWLHNIDSLEYLRKTKSLLRFYDCGVGSVLCAKKIEIDYAPEVYAEASMFILHHKGIYTTKRRKQLKDHYGYNSCELLSCLCEMHSLNIIEELERAKAAVKESKSVAKYIKVDEQQASCTEDGTNAISSGGQSKTFSTSTGDEKHVSTTRESSKSKKANVSQTAGTDYDREHAIPNTITSYNVQNKSMDLAKSENVGANGRHPADDHTPPFCIIQPGLQFSTGPSHQCTENTPPCIVQPGPEFSTGSSHQCTQNTPPIVQPGPEFSTRPSHHFAENIPPCIVQPGPEFSTGPSHQCTENIRLV